MLLGTLLYALVVLVTPFLHHDFTCHDRTPGHCPACLANPPAPRTVEGVSFVPLRLPDAGRIEGRTPGEAPPPVVRPAPGRAPPA